MTDTRVKIGWILLALLIVPVLFYGVAAIENEPYAVRMPFFHDRIDGRSSYVLPAIYLICAHWSMLYLQTKRDFADRWVNRISISAAVLALVFVHLTFSTLERGGWAVYPPLSAMTPELFSDILSHHQIDTVWPHLILQIALLGTLIFSTFRTGLAQGRNQN
ncbi:MAG: hypothetical protein AAGA85_21860 [Bacteroidota bacterium]